MDGWTWILSLSLSLSFSLSVYSALLLFPPVHLLSTDSPVQVPQQGTGPCFLARPPSSLTSLPSPPSFHTPLPLPFFLKHPPPSSTRLRLCSFSLSALLSLCSAHPEPARRSSHQSVNSVTQYQVSWVLLCSQSLLFLPPWPSNPSAATIWFTPIRRTPTRRPRALLPYLST